MSVIDAIAALPRGNAGGAFAELPLAAPIAGTTLQQANLVTISSVTISSALSNRANSDASDSDRIFAYLEEAYPEYLSPANSLSPADSVSSTVDGYYYRYYSASNAYIATSNGVVYYLGAASQNQILPLGGLSGWLAAAIAAGY
jgi:hypothetical protein